MDGPAGADVRASIAARCRELAAWRRSRYQDDLRDPRNLAAADGLEALARHVEALAADDPRLARIARYAAQGDEFTPGQQGAYELGRFHFYSRAGTFDGFVDFLADLAEEDHRENGRFGGSQVPGDEPW